MDYGHKQTTARLIGLERRIKREYSKAYSELKKQADEYFSRFEEKEREQIQKWHNGEITYSDYIKWRDEQMRHGERYNQMIDDMARSMTTANQSAMRMIDMSLNSTYGLNFNYAGYEVSDKMDMIFPFTLVDQKTIEKLLREGTIHLPKPKVNVAKDLRWNRKKITSALTQGILQGDSISKISKRLQKVSDMNRSAAIRNARTLTTGAENGGRLDRYKEAKAMGIPIKKKWEATLDNVTRDSHVDVDGEVQDIDKPFSNGLDYPGGMGPPEEVYNCRCTMVSEIEKHKYSDETRFKALGNMSYEEWKRERGSNGKRK